MEDNKSTNNSALTHFLCIQERKTVEIEGVKKLDSFDKNEFLIDTTLGYLHVIGKDLALGSMNMEKGYLSIEGHIDGIQYLHKATNEKKEGFFKKLFK